MNPKRLLLFTRFPVAGKSKTRLIPALGEEGAAALQRQMTEYTVRQARKTGIPIEIRYTGGTEPQMREWLGDDLDYADQGDGDLGDRMERAFADHSSNGEDRVVIIGTDCPANGCQNIQKAFHELDSNDCVIGPASDGGYYLIGLYRAESVIPPPRSGTSTAFPAGLFQNIEWGGPSVMKQTLAAASGLSVYLLPELDDVDRPEDIPPKISVIIPTLNEEAYLAEALECVRGGFNVEAILVDGGSTDGTRAIVPDCLTCLGGRAAQQNMGAEAAKGELLLFLHADTELPDAWDWQIRETLADDSIALGSFSFRIREDFAGRKFIEDTASWRSRVWKLPYGDQGLFMRRATFERAGGFPVQPIMEDYALVRAARKLGRIITRPEAAVTSGRRWKRHGVWKVTWINKLMILGYHLRIPPEKLAAFYRHEPKRVGKAPKA